MAVPVQKFQAHSLAVVLLDPGLADLLVRLRVELIVPPVRQILFLNAFNAETMPSCKTVYVLHRAVLGLLATHTQILIRPIILVDVYVVLGAQFRQFISHTTFRVQSLRLLFVLVLGFSIQMEHAVYPERTYVPYGAPLLYKHTLHLVIVLVVSNM